MKVQVEEQRLIKVLIEGLSKLPSEGQQRVLRTALAYCGVHAEHGSNALTSASSIGHHLDVSREPTFGNRETLSPKAFLLDKAPATDVERVTCLAYYLSHYRDQPHFKTLDITKLNTEAAQARLSNPAYAVENAAKAGFLAAAGKGHKQISAVGERYIDALPDRSAAKEAAARLRPRRLRRQSHSGRNKT